MWYPPLVLPSYVARLSAVAEAVSFRDFAFSAVVIDGSLALQCDWGEAHYRIGIPPVAFESEGMMARLVDDAVVNVVLEAMRSERRIMIPVR